MVAKLTIDRAGRIVIPKALRDELDLVPGDTLDLESSGEHIILRPNRPAAPLSKEKGIWVFRTGEPLLAATMNDALDRIRTERDAHILGGAEGKRFSILPFSFPLFLG